MAMSAENIPVKSDSENISRCAFALVQTIAGVKKAFGRDSAPDHGQIAYTQALSWAKGQAVSDQRLSARAPDFGAISGSGGVE
ncbi:hypothetical protein [Marinovum sp.]|uniref:hypothetical protein n=1 Tax=Marinovum sp. TaxID=2024839 RepID=UPI003A92460A